jgi:hypothetical protein
MTAQAVSPGRTARTHVMAGLSRSEPASSRTARARDWASWRVARRCAVPSRVAEATAGRSAATVTPINNPTIRAVDTPRDARQELEAVWSIEATVSIGRSKDRSNRDAGSRDRAALFAGVRPLRPMSAEVRRPNWQSKSGVRARSLPITHRFSEGDTLVPCLMRAPARKTRWSRHVRHCHPRGNL